MTSIVQHRLAQLPDLDETRVWLVADWLARVCAPAWLELAGVEGCPAALRGLPPLTAQTVGAAQSTIAEAHVAGAAARNAVRKTLGRAEWAMARAAGWAAARAVGWDARCRVVGDAKPVARDAAWAMVAAASVAAAAGTDLEPTKVELQASALDLLDRMVSLD